MKSISKQLLPYFSLIKIKSQIIKIVWLLFWPPFPPPPFSLFALFASQCVLRVLHKVASAKNLSESKIAAQCYGTLSGWGSMVKFRAKKCPEESRGSLNVFTTE
ncbi:hypothetical protein DIT68_14300 [Brumimicrobium oceani]|uniref:Uncharacterized protein n=1 Tax=Brumimicrobium oceani TaxID=2100725 RepID=A0A2U2X264_9FLAO|nr:hypothetical protein DIT68_14300 [Brumimicrobium oceani]